jgi:hypothetical protein
LRNWAGVIVLENVQTGDGRVYVPGCWRWENLPLALRWSREDEGAHYGAVLVGSIETIERVGDEIRATGLIDDTPGCDGAEACRMMDDGLLRWVSVDPDDVTLEVIDTSITPEQMEEAMEAMDVLYAAAGDVDPGPDSGVVVYEYETGEFIERYTSARIRGATLVDIPAFDTAVITLEPAEAEQPEAPMMMAASLLDVAARFGDECHCGGTCGSCGTLTAGATLMATLPVPAHVFAPPMFAELTPWGTVTELDGGARAFACHVAPWGACHLGSPAGTCVTPPRSGSGYSLFNRRAMQTTDGQVVHVGPISMGGLHFDEKLTWAAAAEAMEDADAVIGWGIAGQDRFGPWMAGVVMPDVPSERFERALRMDPSGDWRNRGGVLELCGVHLVPEGAFPLALVASGRTVTLIGAGAKEMATLRHRAQPAASGGDRDVIRAAVVEGLRLYESERQAAERAPHAKALRALAAAPARQRLASLRTVDEDVAREELRALG